MEKQTETLLLIVHSYQKKAHYKIKKSAITDAFK